MLKIKDDIDLEVLKKYRIKKIEIERNFWEEDIGKIEMDGEDFRGWLSIWGYEFLDYEDKYELDILYDLIKDGLVEKVDG